MSASYDHYYYELTVIELAQWLGKEYDLEIILSHVEDGMSEEQAKRFQTQIASWRDDYATKMLERAADI